MAIISQERDWALIFELDQPGPADIYILGAYCITTGSPEMPQIWQLAVSIRNRALEEKKVDNFVSDDLASWLTGVSLKATPSSGSNTANTANGRDDTEEIVRSLEPTYSNGLPSVPRDEFISTFDILRPPTPSFPEEGPQFSDLGSGGLGFLNLALENMALGSSSSSGEGIGIQSPTAMY